MAEALERMVCPECGLHYRRLDNAEEPERCLRCQSPLVPLRPSRYRIGLPPLQSEEDRARDDGSR